MRFAEAVFFVSPACDIPCVIFVGFTCGIKSGPDGPQQATGLESVGALRAAAGSVGLVFELDRGSLPTV